MPRYFIKLAYNGFAYHGWQIQDNTAATVQEVIQNKLSLLLGTPTEIVGCGRTDTGVHAKTYYAHFDNPNTDLVSLEKNLVFKLNKVLPDDISIDEITRVKDNASARFDATSRTYDYLIHRHKNPFLTNASLYLFGQLNIDLMNEAAQTLLLYEDFTSFSKVNTQTFTNNCEITSAKFIKLNENEYVFKITANRFLRNMVRAIVGTLLEVGKNKITVDEFKKIIESKNRSHAGMSAPAHALYLSEITYPSTIFNV
jgi:tRNA pseudouridine38-40 synthase